MEERTAQSEFAVQSSELLDAVAACGVTHLVTVPDWVQMSVHVALAASNPSNLNVVTCSTEDEAVVISAGLYVGGKTPIVMIQNQGLLACLNAVQHVALNAHIPLPMLVGLFGREFANLGQDPRDSSRVAVGRLEPLLDALGIPYWRLESPADMAGIAAAITASRKNDGAALVLVGANTAWP
jgi:sulfopyruvate decarboxylase TPP-binding subunit